MARPSARSFVPLALLVALLVVGLNTWFAVAAVRSLLQDEAWLAHTWDVIGQNNRIMAEVTTAESSTRGFLITAGQPLLEPYQAVESSLGGDIQRLRDLTVDNRLQQKNSADLAVLATDRMRLLREVIEARTTSGFAGAQVVASRGRGARAMEKLRTVSIAIGNEEQRLLVDRAKEAHHDGWTALFAVSLACVMDLLMIAFVTYYFVQERTLRLLSENDAERLALARAEAERNAEAVRVLNAELEVRVRERTAELEATNRELEAFSYSVSHDLRAPLRTIDGFSLALEEDYADAVDGAGRDYIRRVRVGVQRMGQLIDSLLQLSRITRIELQREPVDVASIAQQVASTLQEENPERTLQFQILPGPEAFADAKLVQVALENLLGNAVKFTGKQADADIRFGWDAENEAWRVSDNGAGFDMQYAHKLFNAFNRLHGDKDFKGSGIGLATVARVVRRHGGRIWADSAVNHGATFWFTLG